MIQIKQILSVGLLTLVKANHSESIKEIISEVKPDQYGKFMEYVVKFNKSYSTTEEFQAHLNHFLKMDEYIEQVNAPNSDYTHEAGHNFYSDWSEEQFSTLLGAKHSQKQLDFEITTKGRKLEHPHIDRQSDEKKVDWNTLGKVSAVKDQGYCGSCWAFVAAGTMESDHAILGNPLIQLSEQQLMDCANEYWGNWGCQGGWQYYAWYYTQYYGLETTDDYPYRGYQQRCRHRPRRGMVATTRGQPFIETANDSASIMHAVYQKPQAAAVQGYTKLFQSYKSGIISSPECGTKVDHAVIITGYDTTGEVPFYIVKNSWGLNWGEKGFGKVKISSGAGTCGINQFVASPNTFGI